MQPSERGEPGEPGIAADVDTALPADPEAHAVLAARSDSPVPWWRSALWISVWLVLPTYGVFYVRSTPGFVSPAHWMAQGWHVMGWWWLAALPAAVGVGALMQRVRAVAQVSALALWVTLTLSLMWAIHLHGLDWFGVWGAMLGQDWLLWPVAILTPAVLWYFSASTLAGRMRQLVIFAAVLGTILGMCFIAYFIWDALWQRAQARTPGLVWSSIWMPRYLGVIYPAVALAIGALIMRLPTRPLRWLAIAFVLGSNLTLSLARIELDTEPPLDRVVADVVAAMPDDATVRTYINLNVRGKPGRSEDWLRYSDPGLYYLCIATERKPDPHEFRRKQISREYRYPVNFTPRQITGAVRRTPTITRIAVWERYPSDYAADDTDPLADALGNDWQRVEQQIFKSRQFWTWRYGDWYRRREYQRTPPDAPPPVNAAASVPTPH